MPASTTSGSPGGTGSPKFTRGLYLPGKDDSPGRPFKDFAGWGADAGGMYDDR